MFGVKADKDPVGWTFVSSPSALLTGPFVHLLSASVPPVKWRQTSYLSHGFGQILNAIILVKCLAQVNTCKMPGTTKDVQSWHSKSLVNVTNYHSPPPKGKVHTHIFLRLYLLNEANQDNTARGEHILPSP